MEGIMAWTDSSMGTFDFSAQTTQSLTGSSSYTVGGITFGIINGSNATSMGIVSGSGLAISPIAATTFAPKTSDRTAPMLSLQLSSVITNFTVNTPLQIWTYWSSQNAAANYDES